MSQANHYEGERLSLKSQVCTVRYIGAVDGKSGAWLGVEWDDPQRGKHNGTHEGRQYFECEFSKKQTLRDSRLAHTVRSQQVTDISFVPPAISAMGPTADLPSGLDREIHVRRDSQHRE